MLSVFASVAALAFLLVLVTSPLAQYQAAAAEVRAQRALDTQGVALAGGWAPVVTRDGYGVTKKVEVAAVAAPGRVAPAAGVPDPGTAKAIAYQMVAARGWGEVEYNCLVALWNRESGWNVYANNRSSGAYGIPQALPGTKMASAGADWATNPATQISWGLGYIGARYTTPCGAWSHSETVGWY